MTDEAILREINYWRRQAANLTAAMQAKLQGASSASITAAGGSKSYSNYSISDFRLAIADAKKQVKAWSRKLSGASALMPKQVAICRSGRL